MPTPDSVELQVPGLEQTVWVAFTADAGRALYANGKGVPRGRILAPAEMQTCREMVARGSTREELLMAVQLKMEMDGKLEPSKAAAAAPPVEPVPAQQVMSMLADEPAAAPVQTLAESIRAEGDALIERAFPPSSALPPADNPVSRAKAKREAKKKAPEVAPAWTCGECAASNTAEAECCESCGVERPGGTT